MDPIKFFSFTMPYTMYTELRDLSHKTEHSVARIIRASIAHELKHYEADQISKLKANK